MSSLETLVAMGFPKELAKSCLDANGDNLEEACTILLSLEPPKIPGSSRESGPGGVGVGSQIGNEVVLGSLSQYDFENGRSACSCICVEAAVSMLAQLRNGGWEGSSEDITNIVNVGVITYEAVAGSRTTEAEHKSVDEVVAAVARYRDALSPATPRRCHQGLVGSETSFSCIFDAIKRERYHRRLYIAVTITKPPETVVAFLPPEVDDGAAGTTSSPLSRQWLLFDSHPRPQLGLTKASVRSFEGKTSLVAGLVQIFPALNLDSGGMMGTMYNMIDCTPFVLREGQV